MTRLIYKKTFKVSTDKISWEFTIESYKKQDVVIFIRMTFFLRESLFFESSENFCKIPLCQPLWNNHFYIIYTLSDTLYVTYPDL